MSKYTYKYTPNGKNAETITTWLKNQPNKAESLNLLILQAERKYGNRDIVDMTTQAFLNDQIGKSSNESTDIKPQPNNQESLTDDKPINSEPSSKKVVDSANPETLNKSKKPNLGFLSNN